MEPFLTCKFVVHIYKTFSRLYIFRSVSGKVYIVEFRSRLLCNEYDKSKCSIMVYNLIGSKGIYDNLGIEAFEI